MTTLLRVIAVVLILGAVVAVALFPTILLLWSRGAAGRVVVVLVGLQVFFAAVGGVQLLRLRSAGRALGAAAMALAIAGTLALSALGVRVKISTVGRTLLEVGVIVVLLSQRARAVCHDSASPFGEPL